MFKRLIGFILSIFSGLIDKQTNSVPFLMAVFFGDEQIDWLSVLFLIPALFLDQSSKIDAAFEESNKKDSYFVCSLPKDIVI